MEAPSLDRGLLLYGRGATTVYACRADPRFVYCLYVPQSFMPGGSEATNAAHRLIVAVHGSVRTMGEFRDAFAPLAEETRCLVLAPLFPVGPLGDENGEGYKYLVEDQIRYDQVLLNMVAEAGARLGAVWRDFFLFGFSGGAQFVNRFLLIHPGRLWGASIAAPGSVTLLDPARDYWVGTRNLETVFGNAFDADAVRAVPVQVIVGENDTEEGEIAYTPGRQGWMEGINASGPTRIARARHLHANMLAAGVRASFELVLGAGHDWRPMMPSVEKFIRRISQAGWAE